MATKRFLFRHDRSPHTGFVGGVRMGHHVLIGWLGYGKPVWWKPRFIGKGKAKYGFGFGWLLLCFKIQVVSVKNSN